MQRCRYHVHVCPTPLIELGVTNHIGGEVLFINLSEYTSFYLLDLVFTSFFTLFYLVFYLVIQIRLNGVYYLINNVAFLVYK